MTAMLAWNSRTQWTNRFARRGMLKLWSTRRNSGSRQGPVAVGRPGPRAKARAATFDVCLPAGTSTACCHWRFSAF